MEEINDKNDNLENNFFNTNIIHSDLTFKDILDAQSILDPMEQQLFYLSRYFNLTKEKIESMPYHQVTPMIAEMSAYMEKAMKLAYLPKVKIKTVEKSDSIKKNELKSVTRAELLDLDE